MSFAWTRYTITGHPREVWFFEKRTGGRYTKQYQTLGHVKRDWSTGRWYGAKGQVFAHRSLARRSVEQAAGVFSRVARRRRAYLGAADSDFESNQEAHENNA